MKNNRKNRLKLKVLVIVLCILIGSVIGGTCLLKSPKEPIISDLTNTILPEQELGNAGGSNQETGSGNDGVPSGKLSQSVHFYDINESKEITQNITAVYELGNNLVFDIEEGTALDNLGKGDIFLLQGEADSFWGELYFGKIAYVVEEDGYSKYVIETPMMDEVFDEIEFDFSQNMRYDNISDMIVYEGVTVGKLEGVDALGEDTDETTASASYLTTKTAPVDSYVFNNGILVTFEIDLLKFFEGNNAADSDEKASVVSGDDAEHYMVYYTKTGQCYHLESCRHSKDKNLTISLEDAVEKGFSPCKVCHAPLIEDKLFEHSLVLSGSVELKNLGFDITSNGEPWTVEKGFDNLAIETTGQFVANASLKGSFEFELSGDDTEIVVKSLNGKENALVISALKEKLFPLAFLQYTGTWSIEVGQAANDINAPFTIGLMLYTDIEGNITASAEIYGNYERSLDYTLDIFKDGEFVGIESQEENEPTFEWGVKAELKADVDVQMLGGSILLYLGNLNVLELALVRLGAEAEGTVAFDTAEWDNGNHGLEADFGICVYLEMVELQFKLKTASKWGMSTELSGGFGPLLRWELWEIGLPNKIYQTNYDAKVMFVSSVLATDVGFKCFKNENGQLVAENENGERQVIYEDEFFVICGIDETFVYFLKVNEDSDSEYDLYRVKRDGTSDKKICEGIKEFLTYDEQYFYYTMTTNSRTIVRLNRATLEEKDICSLNNPITYMRKQEDGYYVVTKKSLLGIFTDYFYYLIDNEGTLLQEYGTAPSVTEMRLTKFKDYYAASLQATGGFLRDTTRELYWLSEDKMSYILTEKAAESGWNRLSAGILVAQKQGGESEYVMVMYRAADGVVERIADVHNHFAIFTVVRDVWGNWYYMDETQEGITLYKMNLDRTKKTVMEFLPKEEYPVSLENCNMIIKGNTVWFYEILEDKEAKVIYCLDLY